MCFLESAGVVASGLLRLLFVLHVLAGKAERSVVAKHKVFIFGYLEVLQFFLSLYFL